jgi:ABC-type phosphate transport system auxiliary subunit
MSIEGEKLQLEFEALSSEGEVLRLKYRRLKLENQRDSDCPNFDPIELKEVKVRLDLLGDNHEP